MKATSKTHLPFLLGRPSVLGGLAVVPVMCSDEPVLEYVGLDEGVARGLSIREVDAGGSVNRVVVRNPLDVSVLMFEGKELVGAKQNRVLDRTVLIPSEASAHITVNCVERGRWAYRTEQFVTAFRAAHPMARRAARLGGQGAVWSEIASKAARLDAVSQTEAAEEMYTQRAAAFDEYLAAFPRVSGQCGSIVCIAGRVVCLDFVSRSDVYGGLHAKLLRGYALDAIEHPAPCPVPEEFIELLCKRIVKGERHDGELRGRGFIGTELVVKSETISMTVLPERGTVG
jgi:hypothetical protein